MKEVFAAAALAALVACASSTSSPRESTTMSTTTPAPTAQPGTRDVVLTRVLDAPVERVWQAWSNADDVMRWWGPTGFTCPVAELDVREGGVSFVVMRAPAEYGGGDLHNTWSYTKVEPLRRIEFTLHFTDKDRNRVTPQSLGIPPGVPDGVRHVVTFKSLGDNKTELTITESGYTSDQAHDLSKAGQAQVLDKLAALVAGK